MEYVSASDLEIGKSELGYGTSNRDKTRERFLPILGSIFHPPWSHASVAIVWPNGTIHPHCDSIESGFRRSMLVIQSTEESWFRYGQDWMQPEQDAIYELDATVLHSAVNWGSDLRVHFVVDWMAP